MFAGAKQSRKNSELLELGYREGTLVKTAGFTKAKK